MPYLFDIEKLAHLFLYDEGDPLLFTTSFFLFLFFGLLILYRLVSAYPTIRKLLLLLFSFYFYYKVSGIFLLLIIGSSVVNYYSAFLISRSNGLSKRIFFISAIGLNLALLGYFKYTNFFIQVITDFKLLQVNPFDVLLPIGISFYTFKAISYLVEIYWETEQPEESLLDFTIYISFFANVLAGPIDRASSFIPQLKQDYYLTNAQIGMAVYFLISGIFKKAVIADYISLNFVDRVFDEPLRFTGAENLLAVYGYTLQVFCDFSGYTDIATGLALLLGFKLMENFRSPYQAASIAEFWRRWHISLSSWLLDYIFRPLQIKFRDYRLAGNIAALLLTFLICGLWHGASWTFIFWGLLHGFYMSFSLLTAKREALYRKLNIQNSYLLKTGKVFITFHLIAFAWIFFRAKDFNYAFDMIGQIGEYFKPGVIPQFVIGYPVAAFLLVTGYLLHFIPLSVEQRTQKLLVRMPLFGKALLLALMIWIAAQFRAADLQPFIYFEF